MAGEQEMGSKGQLGSGILTDALTGQPIGEGYIELRTSAGNKLTFVGPSEAYRYQQANPSQFSGLNAGQFNEIAENPTA